MFTRTSFRTRFSPTSSTSTAVTLVPRVTIQWPARMDVVDYFHRMMNLAEPDLGMEDMNWDHTQTWSIPLRNEFCLKKLAPAAIDRFEDDILHNGKVLKVEFFDPVSHELVVEAEAS